MTLVVDASVLVPAALVGSWAGRLQREARTAPTLIWSEAGSALRQLRYRDDIDDRLVDRALQWLEGAEIQAHPSQDLLREAVQLATALGWAKTYDAEYAVLARRLGVPLVTADARLARALRGTIMLVEPADL